MQQLTLRATAALAPSDLPEDIQDWLYYAEDELTGLDDVKRMREHIKAAPAQARQLAEYDRLLGYVDGTRVECKDSAAGRRRLHWLNRLLSGGPPEGLGSERDYWCGFCCALAHTAYGVTI